MCVHNPLRCWRSGSFKLHKMRKRMVRINQRESGQKYFHSLWLSMNHHHVMVWRRKRNRKNRHLIALNANILRKTLFSSHKPLLDETGNAVEWRMKLVFLNSSLMKCPERSLFIYGFRMKELKDVLFTKPTINCDAYFLCSNGTIFLSLYANLITLKGFFPKLIKKAY